MIDTEHYAMEICSMRSICRPECIGYRDGRISRKGHTEDVSDVYRISPAHFMIKSTLCLMIEEILFTSKLDDEKRLKEIVSRSRNQGHRCTTTAGHSAAATRAMAYFSETAAFR